MTAQSLVRSLAATVTGEVTMRPNDPRVAAAKAAYRAGMVTMGLAISDSALPSAMRGVVVTLTAKGWEVARARARHQGGPHV